MVSETVHPHLPLETTESSVVKREERVVPRAREQAARLLLMAVWFGLFAGLAEVFLVAVRKFFSHTIVFLNPHVVWMAPVADVALFALPGFMLFLLARRWPGLIRMGIAAFTFAFLGSLTVLLRFAWLHPLAALVLALGLGIQAARLIARHLDRFDVIVRRTTVWLVTVVIVLFVCVQGWPWLRERRALAALPPASPGAPNVLLITLDTVRAQSLSLYGYSRPTSPQLEQLAKRSVRFERAFSTAPWTLPSHASMFTGYLPNDLSVDWHEPLDKTQITLAEALSTRGYITAGFIGNSDYCSYETGLNRGFAHYEDYPASLGAIILNSSLGQTIANSRTLRRIVGYHDYLDRKTAAALNGDFLAWLSKNERRPFFVFLNYFDAHEPYLPPEPFGKKFGVPLAQDNQPAKPLNRQLAPIDNGNVSPQQTEKNLRAYDGSIAYLDHQLGLLFDELRKRNLLENTLVIITSDHGEHFGEHSLFEHGNSLYLPLLHVPLLISFPSRVPVDVNVREPVSLHDLPATVVDLLSLEVRSSFRGTSLARYWNGTQSPGSTVAEPVLSQLKRNPKAPKGEPVSKGDMRSLILDRYHYIMNGDGIEELYDFESDTGENNNLALSKEGHEIIKRLKLDR